MAKEREGHADIRAKLRAAGYRLVQLDPKIDSHSNRRVDALAYAANVDGDLVPWLAVEAKNGANIKPEVALSQLRRWRELLGTVEHYAVINGQWFRADRSMRSMEPADGPVGPAYGDSGFLTDPALATSLLMDRLWFETEKAGGKGHRLDFFVPPADLLAETAIPGIKTAGGEFIPVRHDVLWQARRRALASFVLRGPHAGEHTTAPVIADAVGRLTGKKLVGTVLDPFCGTGNFLWAAMDRARELDGRVKFVGQEINTQLAELAEQIARTAPAPATITTGDSFTTELPEADIIVTAPPFGPPVRRPWTLLIGVPARELEVAAIDLCLRKLRPGGRAVFLLPNNITFKRRWRRTADTLRTSTASAP
ncbi:N-6 DNA methylase [Micromonospora sp. WMMA1949]|uniref:N-6 DNA methylase n=1 Tax=Micromonospora sp. WMMA1949 TaxID=3015162 RepID=UPI0022B69A5F|nr:N-6 DNA methylase [Micromonospora sp. WMMA1949]MCZ7424103.1 N-6 DNA methylase [Micromonospora sp. WMMA1949]MCZ7430062.1 N-6 DNA methylase [Micromonospora sp. WMMA1949]MCZ7430087.1 N-6 DNA methylase [Micromonospora sp. WMMA1949]